jgi:tRNA(fMet)-specific endonuclease VapC
MKYVLDTNICIYIIRQKPPQVLQKFFAYSPGDIGISVITVAELQHGAYKSRHPEQSAQALAQFLLPLTVIDFTLEAAGIYGKIRAQLEKQGMSIGPLDLFIAAHALQLNLTLITNNTGEFSRVPDLRVENWAE